MSLILPTIGAFGHEAAAGGSLSAMSYVGNNENLSTGTTTYTFSSEPIGTADSNRWVFVGVCVERNASQTIDSMTIAGQSATMSTNIAEYGGGALRWGWAKVTTGTTGDIVVTVSATGIDFAGIEVYNVTHGSTPSVAEAEFEDVNTATFNLNINTTGGALLAMVHAYCGDAEEGFNWTGPTENSDWWSSGSIQDSVSAASLYPTTTQTPMTVTATSLTGNPGTNYNCVGISLHIT